MRRIDVIGIGFGIFIAGGLVYWLLQELGFGSMKAGIWSQVLLVGGLVVWLLSYLTRVFAQKMTYNQQLKNYEEAFLKKKLQEMTPEELAKLQAQADRDTNLEREM